MFFPYFTQRTQWGFLLTRQHQRGISLHRELTGLGIVTVANRDHARALQITQQTVVSTV